LREWAEESLKILNMFFSPEPEVLTAILVFGYLPYYEIMKAVEERRFG